MIHSSDQKKVLEMLAAGKLTVEQAQQLLDKLASSSDDAAAGTGTDDAAHERASEESRRGRSRPRTKPRHIRIRISDTDGDDTDIRIPFGFARAGLKLGAMLPEWAHACVVVNGCDLSDVKNLSPEELESLDISVDSGDGKVRINAE